MAPEDGEFDGCETMPHAFFHPSPSAPSVFAMAKGFAALGSDFYTELRPPCHPPLGGNQPFGGAAAGAARGVASVKKPCRRSQATRCWQALPRWPACTAATSSAFGRVSWATAGPFAGRAGWRARNPTQGRGRTPHSRMGDGGLFCAPASANSRAARPCTAGHSHITGSVHHGLAWAGAARGAGNRRRRHPRGPSFVRFGHFEHFAANDQEEQLRTLADYVIDRYYPECRSPDATSPWAATPTQHCCTA